MIYFTADTHFFHKNILKYTKRPWASIEEMNEELITLWNKKISRTDEIYHLGDFAFCSAKKADEILQRLNGIKYLIRGNHDYEVKKLAQHFVWIKDYFELKQNHQLYILCHYPLLTWNKKEYGSIMLHGHTHGAIQEQNKLLKRFDIGIDASETFEPFSIEEINEKAAAVEATETNICKDCVEQ